MNETVAATEEVKLPLVYVGPTSPRLGLVKYTLYTGLNPVFQSALERFPALKKLFIPLDELKDRSRLIYAGLDPSINHLTARLLKDEVL